MIRVWSDNLGAGLLDRHGTRGAAFAYDPSAHQGRAVSLTMPVRLASWNQEWGIHPIFEMNLPEGFLREKLRLGFAKAAGTFDDIDLLAVVGRSQIGRLRYTAPDDHLDEEVPFQSVDEILRHRRDGDLFSHMMDRFARYSGIAGVQPKVMIRDETNSEILESTPRAPVAQRQGATHIVKFLDPADIPISPPMNSSACWRQRRPALPCPGADCPRTPRRSLSTVSTSGPTAPTRASRTFACSMHSAPATNTKGAMRPTCSSVPGSSSQAKPSITNWSGCLPFRAERSRAKRRCPFEELCASL